MPNASKEKNSSSDDFLGLLVHSYNNHLAAMMGFTEIALLECRQDSLRDRLNTVVSSGIEAVDLGNHLLASIGRLQIQMSQIELACLVEEIKTLEKVSFIESIGLQPKPTVKTNLIWFKDCIGDLLQFVNGYAKQKPPKILIELKSELEIIEIRIKSDIELTDDESRNLFQPFYSSRQLLDTKDIGLAKANGFFGQMHSTLIWKNNQGFILRIPISH